MKNKKVAVLMGSDSDLNFVKPAIEQLKELEIETEISIVSAHRTPNMAEQFAKTAKQKNFAVIVAAASLAAHLAGSIAAHTTLPVIGIPIESKCLGGLDSLLSTVQMPPGVPVATVAINGAKNAALLAAQIIAVFDEKLSLKLEKLKATMRETVEEKNKNLKNLSF